MGNSNFIPIWTVLADYPNGPYQKTLAPAITKSLGPASAGSIPVLGANGQLDPSFGGGGSYIYPTVSLSVTPSQVEVATTMRNCTLNWTVNKTMTFQTLTGDPSLIPSGSVDITPGTTFFVSNGPITPGAPQVFTFNILVGDGLHTATSSCTLTFNPARYWGVNVNALLTNDQVLGLPITPSGGKDLEGNYNLTIAYNCSTGGGDYPYFCFPFAYGTPSNVTVGGLAFSAFTVTQQTVTNLGGYSANYNIIRFNFIQTGANIRTVWA
jgi:hypothetical protein